MRRKRDPTRKKQSRLARGLFDPLFAAHLATDFNPKRPRRFGYPPPPPQASARQPARNLDTPSSSAITNSTPLPTTLYESPSVGTLLPPAVGNQPVSSPASILIAPRAPLAYNEQGPTSGSLTVMDNSNSNNNIGGYGYPPRGSTRGTSDFNPGTPDTRTYPSPSPGGWNTRSQPYYSVQTTNTPNMLGQQAWGNTQNQHSMGSYSVQTPNTSSQPAWELPQPQPQPQVNLGLPTVPLRSFMIRAPDGEWAGIPVLLNPYVRRSYITLLGLAAIGLSLSDLTPFPPGSHGWTQDGGPLPAEFVTAEITAVGLLFSSPVTTENIAVWPLAQPSRSNAGLIMGWELWQRLDAQQGGGGATGSQPFGN